MRLLADIRRPAWLYAKACAFLVAGTLGAIGLWLEAPTWRTVVLIALTVWAFARLYYFAFYVIEHYIDPSHRFSGLFACLRYLLGRRRHGRRDPSRGSGGGPP